MGGGEKEEGERGGRTAPASVCRQAKRICATKHPDGRKNSPFTNWIPGRFLQRVGGREGRGCEEDAGKQSM